MAEIVHLRLEHGLKELEEMVRIKLFTKEEIRKIAKKRKLFEYRLRRRDKSKEDFLQYIEFEICLLFLISKRRERLLIELKKEEIDNSIAKKINRLFKAVISRYPEDEKLWLNQIEYVKRMKWNESLSALFTKLLQVHSKKPEIWISAAKWEMEENNSFENALKLFQRGVLMNPRSKALWKEFFRMSLKYEEKVRMRRDVLQLNKNEDAENDAILKSEICNAIFDRAIEEIPEVEYGLSFMSICFEFDFATKVADYILSNVQKNFPVQEEIMDAVAKQPLYHLKERSETLKKKPIEEKNINRSAFKEILSKYDEAIKMFHTEKMWTFYLDFLFRKLETCKGEKSIAKTKSIILSKMEEAADSDCLSMDYYIKWINLLKNTDKEKALFVARSGAHKWNKVQIWVECLLLFIQLNNPKEITYLLLTEALSTLNEKDSLQIWKIGIDWLTMMNSEKLIEFFEKGINKDEEIGLPLKEMYLETIALRDGVEAARNLYKRFKAMGPLTPLLYQKMVKIEKTQMKPSFSHIRACFEDMLKENGHNNIDVWLQFLEFEATYGQDPQAIERLQWRGKKTLEPELIEEFQARITKVMTEGQSSFNQGFNTSDFD